MVAAPKLKAVSRPHELAFIEVARKIREKQITSLADIPTDLKQFTSVAQALCTARIDFDEANFWTVYTSLAIDHPKLAEWRKSIETSSEIEEEEEDPRFVTGTNGKKVFRTLSMQEIKQLPRAEWQIPGIYQKVSVSMTYGDANTGKTFVDLDIALHLAYGMFWQGRQLMQSRVLYIYGEGNEGLANRVEAWQRKHGKEDSDYIRFICFPVQLMTELTILCDTIEDQEETPGLIVLDTFSVCASGIPENDNVEVAKFIACASHIKRTYKTRVNIIHHAGKNGDYRGAAAFRGNVDTMTLLVRESNESPIVMVCKKQKDAAYFSDIKLQLEQISLGIDPDSYEPITSCVVITCDLQTHTEEKTEQERATMLKVLADNGRMSSAKWKDACIDAGISRNVWYTQKDYLTQTGKIQEDITGP